jgi:dCTP deaminase
MTVLSNTEMQNALHSGRLTIEPQPTPGPGEEGTPYDTISVDLRLSSEISVPRQGLNLTFDLREKGLAKTLEAVYERREIPESGWILQAGQFILGTTIERVGLPLGEGCLAARIEGRSSLARTGLLVHFTAPTIHPGFEGHVTLEIINLGAIPLTLRPGMRLCQLIVETVEGSPVRADSQFQGQARPTGSLAG